MEILDKYKDIITRIEEMCTSTAAMAPYPTGGISVTTIHSRGRKGKSRKAMLNYKYTKQWGNKNMDITETMNEIAILCEAIIKGEVISEDEFTKDRIKNNIKSFFGLEQKKHPNYFTKTGAELRAKRDKVEKIGDNILKYGERAERATGHRKEVNQQRMQDAAREHAQANKEWRHAKDEVLDSFRSKGDSNPEAHKKLGKMIESITTMCNEILGVEE